MPSKPSYEILFIFTTLFSQLRNVPSAIFEVFAKPIVAIRFESEINRLGIAWSWSVEPSTERQAGFPTLYTILRMLITLHRYFAIILPLPHFWSAAKTKGGTLENEIFFVEWGLRKRLEGSQEYFKTLPHLFKQQKIKNVALLIAKYLYIIWIRASF